MTIMRSCYVMKDKLFKKRKRVDWDSLRIEIGDPDVDLIFWTEFAPKKMSNQRKSYCALLRVYGKRRLDAYRYSGIWR